jgi:hypothetical protein
LRQGTASQLAEKVAFATVSCQGTASQAAEKCEILTGHFYRSHF